MFEHLFKYPEQAYRQAEWFFVSGWSQPLLGIAVAVASLLVAFSLKKHTVSFSRRLLLWVLQTGSIAVLLTLLWQPAIRSKVIAPGENSLVVLLDTSRSMAYVDDDKSRLLETIAELEKTDVLDTIGEDFNIELLSVADLVQPLDLDNPPLPGDRSEIRAALLQTLDSASSRVLSGIVLLSDGADTSSLTSNWWKNLANFKVPIYAIGVGQEVLADDIALDKVSVDSNVTPDTPVIARVSIRYGQAGAARLRVMDGDNLLYAETLELPQDSHEINQLVKFNSGEAGLRDLRFELDARDGEKNLTNNVQRRILSVEDKKRRVLYVEGEPRWEFKFIRRAVSASTQVDLVTLLHTSPNKFYRQGVRNSEELKDGFPATAAELFEYDAIIIGSLEAAMLSDAQQSNLREFVRRRGGSLLMLAGANGLGNGGWARSVVAQALPVVMSNQPASYSRDRVQANVTALGYQTEWLKFSNDDSENRTLWQALPLLADIQFPGSLKPGATVLLNASIANEQMPLLSWQRYGRGKSYILATSGTWRWQMGLPASDQRHELFWQGLIGDLVAGVLPRLVVDTNQAVYMDESRVKISMDVRNEDLEPDTNAKLSVQVNGPGLNETDISMSADPERPGRYIAELEVPEAGEFSVLVTPAGSEGVSDPAMTQSQWFLRQNDVAEDHALAMDRPFLERLSEETGGSYLPLAGLKELPDRVKQSKAVLLREEILPLWNIPAAFLLLFFLKLLDWGLRWRWNRL